MSVPYTFATATGSLPLSQLDANFATAITIGNSAVLLGGTITTLNNMSLANLAITSVNTQFPNGFLANSNVVIGTTTINLGSTVTSLDSVSLSNVTITSGNVTISNVTVSNFSATTANVSGTANVNNLVVIGNTSVGGNVSVTGNVTAAKGTFTSSNVSGTANVQILAVTQDASVAGNISSTGNITGAKGTFSSANVSGTANVQVIAVTQDATIAGNITATGNITGAKGTFTSANISGIANVTIDVIAGGNISSGGNASVGSNLTVSGNSATTGNTSVSGKLAVGTTNLSLAAYISTAASTSVLANMYLPGGSLQTGTGSTGYLESRGTAPNIGLYFTLSNIIGRGFIPIKQYYVLSSNSAAIGPAITNFYGATSAISLIIGTYYELEYHLYFTKTTAGTVTFTLVSSDAPVNLNASYVGTPVGGVGTVGAPQTAALVASTATSAALPVTGSLTTGVNHYYVVKAIVFANASTSPNLKLQITSSAGTVTPLTGSYFTTTQLPATNNGVYV